MGGREAADAIFKIFHQPKNRPFVEKKKCPSFILEKFLGTRVLIRYKILRKFRILLERYIIMKRGIILKSVTTASADAVLSTVNCILFFNDVNITRKLILIVHLLCENNRVKSFCLAKKIGYIREHFSRTLLRCKNGL